MSPNKVRVALDLTPLPPSRAGVGSYALGLLGGLSEACAAGELDLVCIVKAADAETAASRAPHAELVEVPSLRLGRPGRLAWEQTGLVRLLGKIRPDIFHGIHYTLPLASTLPATVVLHDPTFWTHPHLHAPTKVAYFRTVAPSSARKARLVLTVSEWSRRELSRLLRIEPEKVRAIHHGVDDYLLEPESPEELASLRSSLDATSKPLVAFLGTLEPRKNIPRLVMAVEKVRDILGDPGVVLAVAGQKGWKTKAIEDWLTRGERAGWLVRLGYVDERTKRLLLQAADVVAYPSLAEGFGIPVLEAFASGTPVLTSDRTATAEVAGDSALVVDPYDVGAISRGLVSLLTDASLRSRLSEAGRKRASRFSWREAAAETLKVWREILLWRER